MRTKQELWTIAILLVLGLALVVGMFVLRRKSPASVKPRSIGVRAVDTTRACTAMHAVNPGVACADPMCKETAACLETGRAVNPPNEVECDAACDELEKRIREDPTMSDVDLCDYNHCAHMTANIPVCQVCSIDYPQLCVDEGEYAEAIERECAGTQAADPGYARCAAACVDLTADGTQPEEACYVPDGFCSWAYAGTCHPCSFEELGECDDVEIVDLISKCAGELELVPFDADFECANDAYSATEVFTAARVGLITVSPNIVINDVAVDKSQQVGTYVGLNDTGSVALFVIQLRTQIIPCVQSSVVELVPQDAVTMASSMKLFDYEELPILQTGILFLERPRAIGDMIETPVVSPVGGMHAGTIDGIPTDILVLASLMVINNDVAGLPTDGEILVCAIYNAANLGLTIGDTVEITIGGSKSGRQPTATEKEVVFGHKLMKQLLPAKF